MRARFQPTAPRVSALALLALTVLLALGAFVHTDDGCAVERHCLACRFALQTADGTTPIATSLPTLGPSEDVRAEPAQSVGSGQTVVLASRGPPAA